MPKRITAEEAALPDVIIRMTTDQWRRLPAELKEELEPFQRGYLVFRIAGYRWRDLQIMARSLAGHVAPMGREDGG